jgi:hypothetical protein
VFVLASDHERIRELPPPFLARSLLMSNPYGNPFDSSPSGSRKQGGASLYDLIPPGWESGASVEALRKQQTTAQVPTLRFRSLSSSVLEMDKTSSLSVFKK